MPDPAPSLVVRFTRTSPTHHRLEVVRGDGSREQVTLETRSCLVHDLVHFAVESEAGLSDSFFGRLARDTRHATLAEGGMGSGNGEIVATEKVVGALQGALARSFDPAAFLERFADALASSGDAPPAWLTEDLLVRVQEQMRRLEGRWRATPFGTAMELRFPLPSVRA